MFTRAEQVWILISSLDVTTLPMADPNSKTAAGEFSDETRRGHDEDLNH